MSTRAAVIVASLSLQAGLLGGAFLMPRYGWTGVLYVVLAGLFGLAVHLGTARPVRR